MTPPLGNNFPSSVKADYETMNALRTFVIQASAISLACGILVGIQRRKSTLIILWSFVISGVTMSFVAILQKLSGTDKILWVFDVTNANPWGTFAYRNQGAAFLILVFLITGLLYFLYKKRASIKLKQGGPHLLLLLCTFLLTGSIWLSLSRGGIILSLLLFFAFLGFVFFKIRREYINHNWRKLFLLSTVIGATLSLFVLNLSDWKEVEKRWNHLQRVVLNLDDYDRVLSSKATWEMSQERLVYGWGAGSFRYIFPIFQMEYEQLSHFYDHRNKPYGRKIYNYAHNDWIQFLAEYGIVGIVVMIFLVFCLMSYLGIISKVSLSAACLLLVGVSLIFAHNFIDFIFSSPAYWVAFFGSLLLIGKLYYLEFKA
jgi:O-antigen ligase